MLPTSLENLPVFLFSTNSGLYVVWASFGMALMLMSAWRRLSTGKWSPLTIGFFSAGALYWIYRTAWIMPYLHENWGLGWCLLLADLSLVTGFVASLPFAIWNLCHRKSVKS